ncbi:MAG: PhoU domain-containing protein [Candidatus Omnitrophica bacterium]|nr:PhoU domain-containing protein [Candidatus Omnitrophota bacterium]
MPQLNDIKLKIAGMSGLALKMWQATFRTFMENNPDLITAILEDENKVNNLEKEITAELVDFSRTSADKSEKAKVIFYADIVADLELIGDYCKDILERVQTKIEEKLLFSEDAVREYSDLYRKTEDALKEITAALEKDNPGLVKEVFKKQGHIDTLVDEYRARHNQRLIDKVCTPIACNMFLNMLDFTAAVYYHAKKIARSLLKIKS